MHGLKILVASTYGMITDACSINIRYVQVNAWITDTRRINNRYV